MDLETGYACRQGRGKEAAQHRHDTTDVPWPGRTTRRCMSVPRMRAVMTETVRLSLSVQVSVLGTGYIETVLLILDVGYFSYSELFLFDRKIKKDFGLIECGAWMVDGCARIFRTLPIRTVLSHLSMKISLVFGSCRCGSFVLFFFSPSILNHANVRVQTQITWN
ncbi:hypothetical protein B0T17DRAFT_36059 [Bombardia bombarda]|uniref:Uncharacterized protein n=1 Tax=Bombardia bombarda TaxID=252184 RepID=A0AA40CE91_9PEZI|nr:hypothetical protein B0T17DRAFT_36059 [Bombardia bombarda]